MVKQEHWEIVSSTILEYENEKNPDLFKKSTMEQYLKQATTFQGVDEIIRERARELQNEGLKLADSFHVASAEASKCDYFITCDKGIINKCKKMTQLRVLNPVDFFEEVSDDN